MRQYLTSNFSAALGGQKAAAAVQNALGQMLGDAGLGWLKDVNDDGQRNAQDITATPVTDANGKAQRMDFVVPLGRSLTATAPIGFDIGLRQGITGDKETRVMAAMRYYVH